MSQVDSPTVEQKHEKTYETICRMPFEAHGFCDRGSKRKYLSLDLARKLPPTLLQAAFTICPVLQEAPRTIERAGDSDHC